MTIALLAISPILLLVTLIRSLITSDKEAVLKRFALYSLIWVVQSVLNCFHIVGFICDLIFFRRSKSVTIEKPIFIIGVPRSGTTYLQRVLAQDKSLTTLRTWECIFAPSISERYFWLFVAKLLFPLQWLVSYAQRRLFRQMDSIHKIALNEPEEDFLLFTAIHGCFLFFVLAPNDNYWWRLSRFDEQVPSWWQNQLMRYYKVCLQKHLYFHGQDKRVLSKNPSFTSMLGALSATFPDAKFIACTRAPHEAIASQFSSLKPAMALLSTQQMNQVIQARLYQTLTSYYRTLATWGHKPECMILPIKTLQYELASVAEDIYQHCDLSLSETFISTLRAESSQSKQYKSKHKYDLAEFSLSNEQVNRDLGQFWSQHQALAA